jgi:hypothetical protein
MNKDDFGTFLRQKRISEDKIEQFVSIAEDFERFLEKSGNTDTPNSEDVNAFSRELIKDNRNSWDNYRALIFYGEYIKNKEVFTTAVELIDGSEALDNLFKKAGQVFGEEKRDEIFSGIDLPPLGTPTSQRPKITQAVMERIGAVVGYDSCKNILKDSVRDLDDNWYTNARKKYKECGNFSEFLKRRKQDFLVELERIKNEKELYFTQEIDDSVIEFVKNHPEIQEGVLVGNILYETKIPYMTREWLAEPDKKMKQYYYCHCPWVRESLRSGTDYVPPVFCNCSAGFQKRLWEVIFDQPLKAEVVESVLKGDDVCRFAIYLPEDLI